MLEKEACRWVMAGCLGAIIGVTGPAQGSDLAQALTFAKDMLGEEAIDGFEDIVDYDPDEALALLLSPVIEPNRPPSAYSTEGPPAKSTPHFATLGKRRLSYRTLRPFIEEASAATGLPVALIDAVIRTESGYRPDAVSRAGAQGLMQLMPKTGRALGVVDPFDPRENILAGSRYLRDQYDRFGALSLAVAAYNAGPARVSRAGGVPNIPETRRYVAAVLTRFRESPLR